MTMPLISVIIPVYNVERYLARCLDSVIQNTYRNLEIICVDDGSTDGSPEILRDYAQRDARITVITKENGGVSSARNAGLDRMTGEFVTFIDSDDFVHPQYFELFIKAEKDTNADMIIGGFRGVSDQELPVEMDIAEYRLEDIKKVSVVQVFKNHYLGGYCTARLIRKSVIGTTHFDESLSYAEDSAFISALWEQFEQMNCWVLNQKQYYYYNRQDSATCVIRSEIRIEHIRNCFKNAASPNNRCIWLVQAVCRSLRFLGYYTFSEPDENAVKAITKEMRAHVFQIWCSKFYSLREKMSFSFKAFFPKCWKKIVV